MNACKHGNVPYTTGRNDFSICVACVEVETGVPAIAVTMVLGSATRRMREFVAARAALVPAVAMEDVLAAHEVFGRKDALTLSDLGLAE